MSEQPAWDEQFAETEDERNERLRHKRLREIAPPPMAEPLTDAEIAAMEARAMSATPGPWHAPDDDRMNVWARRNPPLNGIDIRPIADCSWDDPSDAAANAAFMAAARSDVPRLAAELRAARAALREAAARIEQLEAEVARLNKVVKVAGPRGRNRFVRGAGS